MAPFRNYLCHSNKHESPAVEEVTGGRADGRNKNLKQVRCEQAREGNELVVPLQVTDGPQSINKRLGDAQKV